MVQSQRRLFPPMRTVSAHSAHIFLSVLTGDPWALVRHMSLARTMHAEGAYHLLSEWHIVVSSSMASGAKHQCFPLISHVTSGTTEPL